MKRTILALLPTGMVGAARPCAFGHGYATWWLPSSMQEQTVFGTDRNATTPARRPRSSTG